MLKIQKIYIKSLTYVELWYKIFSRSQVPRRNAAENSEKNAREQKIPERERTDMNENDREILLNCLSVNDRQLENVIKKRRLYIRDLSAMLGSDDDSLSYTSLSDATEEQFNLVLERFEEGSGAEVGFKSSKGELLSVGSIAGLCGHLAKNMKCPSILTPHIPEGSRICYFRNRFSDSAFLAFSSVLPDATASYTEDYASACEGVYYGKFDYCILPCENYSDGYMSRFIGLMQKYELYTALSCKISAAEDDFTVFNLMSASQTCMADPDRMSVTAVTGAYPVWKLLSTAELLGAKTLCCTALPARLYSENSYYITFDISEADADALAIAMQLTVPVCSINGIYRQIDAGR